MKTKKLDLIRAFKAFANTEDGQIIFKHLLKISGFCQTTYSENPNAMAFKEGRRSLMLEILALVEMKETDVHNMIAKFKQNEGI